MSILTVSFDPPSAGSLLFVAFADETNPQNSIAAGSGYTLIQGDGNHVDIEEDNLNSSAGPQTASISVGTATWSWAMYVVEFLPAAASSPPPPVGTVLWTNTGDGSGFSSIVPAVPSASGVADIFGLQNDGTVAAITSAGATAWSADVSQAATVVPDFLGGLALLMQNSSIVDLNGTTGAPNSTLVPSDPTANLFDVAVHTDGTIFAVQNISDPQNTSVVGINPTTGAQIFSVSLEGSSPNYSYFNVLSSIIVAGDGYAYLAYSYIDGDAYPFVAHLMLLRVDSSGNSNTLDILDQPAYGSSSLLTFRANLITNADTGVLISWEQAYIGIPGLRPRIAPEPAPRSPHFRRADILPPTSLGSGVTYGMAITAGAGVTIITSPAVSGQVTNIAPVLQREDGSFIGTVGVGDPSNPQYNMVAFDQTGNLLWTVANDQPQIATADGGVIGQSGTTYDQNGNATGQVTLYTQSWTYNSYQIQGAAINEVFSIPALLATTYAFQQAEPAAVLPLPDRVKASTDSVGPDPFGGGAVLRDVSYTLLQGAHKFAPAKNAVIQEKLIYISGQHPQAASSNAGKPYEDQVGTRGKGPFDLRQQMLAVVPGEQPYRVQIVPCIANNQPGAAVWENRNIVSDQQVSINNDTGSTQGRTCQVP